MKIEQLKEDLKNYKEDILTKNIEMFSLENIKAWDLEKWKEELTHTIFFSFSSVISSFIEENTNEECFKQVIDSSKYNGDVDKYIEDVVFSVELQSPFSSGKPIEFFDVLEDFAKELIEEIR